MDTIKKEYIEVFDGILDGIKLEKKDLEETIDGKSMIKDEVVEQDMTDAFNEESHRTTIKVEVEEWSEDETDAYSDSEDDTDADVHSVVEEFNFHASKDGSSESMVDLLSQQSTSKEVIKTSTISMSIDDTDINCHSKTSMKKYIKSPNKTIFDIKNKQNCSYKLNTKCKLTREQEIVSKSLSNGEWKLNVKNSSKKHKTNENTKNKPYSCHLCSYMASDKSNLTSHVNAVHKGVKPYSCHLCSFSSSRNSHLTSHISAIHEGIRPYSCHLCSYTASHKNSLPIHVNAVHKGLKPYSCHLCSYAASHKSLLTSHVNAVHEGLKPYSCHLCSYTASRNSYLTRHVNAVHEGLKLYSCHLCSFMSSQKSGLTSHVNAVHMRLKPYSCHLCSYTASRKSSITTHINTVHKGV